MRRLLVLLVLALLAVPAATSARIVVGIADQKPDMFSDSRFLALNITHARVSVPWDAIEYPSELAPANRWLTQAHAAGIDPLVSFDHSNRNGHHTDLPTPGQYRHAFVLFHRRYPWITDYATWNESNWGGEVTWRHPDAVAGYYKVLRAACPGCNVLAGEILDYPPYINWVKQEIHYIGFQPHLWGLHNYVGANNLSATTTQQMLAAVTGDVWFTETGGLVARHNHSKITFPESVSHAALVDSLIFNRLAKLSSRVQRVYLYEWDAETAHDGWDSALIAYNHTVRPGYDVLAKELTDLGDMPNCGLSALPPSCVSATPAGGAGASQ